MPGRHIRKTWEYNPALDAPPKYRRACHYAAFVPETLSKLNISLDGDVSGTVSEAEARIRDLNGIRSNALAPLARLLLRTESIASSKVEGLQMGAKELARAEAKMETGQRVGGTAAEIIANIDAMELAIDEAARASVFQPSDICEIHARLMVRSAMPEMAGRVRLRQNWIGGNDYNPCGADFVPPPPEYVDPLLADLCAAINDDVLPPIVQAALVHAQFETIHPFDDGNGRTGRALVHVVLRRRGIASAYVPPISVILAASRDRYITGLTNFRNRGVGAWIEYFAGVSMRAAALAISYVEAVDTLVQSWKAMLAASPEAPRAGATAWVLLDLLPGYPLISAPVLAAAAQRTKPRVYEGLAALEAAGVIAPLTHGKRNQIWEAVGLLDLIAGLESGTYPST